VPANLS